MDFHADLMARSSNQLKDLLNLANQGPRIKHLFESASKFPPKNGRAIQNFKFCRTK